MVSISSSHQIQISLSTNFHWYNFSFVTKMKCKILYWKFISFVYFVSLYILLIPSNHSSSFKIPEKYILHLCIPVISDRSVCLFVLSVSAWCLAGQHAGNYRMQYRYRANGGLSAQGGGQGHAALRKISAWQFDSTQWRYWRAFEFCVASSGEEDCVTG